VVRVHIILLHQFGCVFSPLMAASATFALKAGAWVRRNRLVIVIPDPPHPRRCQAQSPLIDLSEFGQPPHYGISDTAGAELHLPPHRT
jgi:hypothetical protein